MMTLPRILFVALGGALLLAAAHFTDVRNSFCLDRLPISAATVRVSDEPMIDEKFAVQPGEMLEIRVSHSDVIITPGPSDQARVRVTVSGRNMDRARAFFEHLNFSVEKSGRTLSITTNSRGNWNWNGSTGDIEVFVSVPEVFDADVRTSHGDVEVGSLKGRLSFASSHGDLEVGSLSGSLLSVTSAHGDIEAERLTGEKIRIEASHGDVEAGEIVGSEIESSMQHGDLEIGRLEGTPSLSATHGDIEIALVRAGGGTFRTSHGDIDVSMPGDTAADVLFSASQIDIASAFRFEGTKGRDSLEGRLNGGGPRFVARASHGSVRFHAD